MSDLFYKNSEYYENVRLDILPLITLGSHKVLEIGCGAGRTLEHLRNTGYARWVGGIELNKFAAESARSRVNRLWVGDAVSWLNTEEGPQKEAPFDIVLCLDVLEHLIDPWTVTTRLSTFLKPGGSIIAVLPNIRFYKVALNLLLRGEWKYEESGVMDSTHLRFFTRSTIVALFEQAGFNVKIIQPVANMKPWRLKWLLNKASHNQLIDIYAHSYRLRADKAS